MTQDWTLASSVASVLQTTTPAPEMQAYTQVQGMTALGTVLQTSRRRPRLFPAHPLSGQRFGQNLDQTHLDQPSMLFLLCLHRVLPPVTHSVAQSADQDPASARLRPYSQPYRLMRRQNETDREVTGASSATSSSERCTSNCPLMPAKEAPQKTEYARTTLKECHEICVHLTISGSRVVFVWISSFSSVLHWIWSLHWEMESVPLKIDLCELRSLRFSKHRRCYRRTFDR